MRGYLIPIVALGFLLFSACSSSPSHHQAIGKVTPEQVQQSTDLNQLHDLQRSLQTFLKDQDVEKFPAETALLAEVNRQIVALHTDKLEKALDAARIRASGDYQGIVPLPELDRLKKELTENSDLTKTLAADVLPPITREENRTADLIKTLENESNNPELTAERRASVYHQLYVASGETQWQEIRDKQMNIIVKAIHSAAAQNIFNNNLEEKIDFIRSIYVEQPSQVIDDMHKLYADMFANRFLTAHAKGNFRAAFKVIQDLENKKDYEKIRAKLKPRAAAMAMEFATYVTQSVERGWNLSESFERYEQEREVRRILGLPAETHPLTDRLQQQLSTKFKTLESQKNPFAALGILYAQEVIEPKSETISSALRQQHQAIKDTTINSVSVVKFRSRSEENFGELLSSLINQRLYDLASQDFQVIEQNASAAGPSADALIKGNILEVKIDSAQTSKKKQMRVTVGEDQRANPAYLAWLELSPKERAKTEKPTEIIRDTKQESIFITSTIHRKSAVFAVSYRLVTTHNDRVIFPDSITLQSEHEDESSEGLEVGELVVPYKVAKLPSDTEILHKLAQDVASAIASNLVAVLRNQEIEYLKIADKFAAQNNCSQEVENLAKAASLLQTKERNTDAEKVNKVRQRLIDRTLTCA